MEAIRALESEGKTAATAHADAVSQREFFVDKILVRIHLIMEMVLVDRPCFKGG